MNKRRWIAVSVVTEEAFRACLADETLLIAVEKPLYPGIKSHLRNFAGINDYELTEYESLDCIMLKKVRGKRTFDDSHFEIFYFPFYRL